MFLKPIFGNDNEVKFEIYREVIDSNAKKLILVATMEHKVFIGKLQYFIKIGGYGISRENMQDALLDLEEKITTDILEEVTELAKAGQTISAVALYRNKLNTNSTLHEALSYVRNLNNS
ncbi:hypothetical protein D3C87_75470 [compost metagenome]